MLSEEMNSNEEVETLPKKQDEVADSELKAGWWTFRPKAVQFLNSPLVFLIVAVMLTGPQVMLSGLLPSIQYTMKIRFKLSDKEWNALTIVQGVSAMVATIVMGYLGGFRNKIRWITAGMVMTGIGGIFFAIPHYVIDKYEPKNLSPMMLNMFGLCGLPPFPCNEVSIADAQMALFVIGQILIGAGIAPLYTLVPAYIDENVRPESMPMYIMAWFLHLLLGRIAAFLVGGFFTQKFYVDIKQPDLFLKLTPDDMRWIGAWWLPFLIFGIITLVNAIQFLGFPERLPGSRAICIENMQQGNIPHNDSKIKRGPTGIIYATVSLLKNKTYIFNTLAFCSIVFYLVTMGPFLIRLMMIKYGADPKKVALPFGIVLLLGTIVGIILGGFLVKRLGLKRIAKGAAFICLITQTVCLLTPLLFVIPGCNDSNIAGVSTSYPPLGKKAMLKQNGTSELTATCNAKCKCSTFLSTPVCGSNNVAYFDPCHAGCMKRVSEKNFANCTCVPATKPGHNGGEAKLGFCDRGCKSWAFFLVTLFFVLVILGANVLPSKVVVLRCVPHNQRCYALSFQAFLAFLVGLIPSHLVKYMMDQDCNIWQTDPCGRKGICWDYKANSMTKSIAIFGFLVTALAMVFYFLSWYFYERPTSTRNGRLLTDTNDDENKETNL